MNCWESLSFDSCAGFVYNLATSFRTKPKLKSSDHGSNEVTENRFILFVWRIGCGGGAKDEEI
ncbi:hypothetical protein ANAPC1_01518 [Anaplasma phagocytophilum]|uniref:Uncharacterized protein n=1 Tax=Anaplasma phagocytophilum TaxID=948 RepID=A0AA45UUC6_ANAPH|nr:hypothetical protein ANAPC1_01518 [Anaplasma phagocytophilum]